MMQMSNSRLDKLLTELSDQLPVADESEIHQAVRIVGENHNRAGVPVWVLNQDVAVDAEGELVDPKDFGLVWLSHMTNGDGINMAKEEYSCNIKLPLGTETFDVMCHFLNGSLEVAASRNPEMRNTLRTMLPDSLQYLISECDDADEVNILYYTEYSGRTHLV